MSLSFRQQRLVALVAALALLLAALLPALSSARMAVRTAQSPWLVICSVHNPLSSAATRTASDPQSSPGAEAARCPMCLAQAPVALPTPTASNWLMASALSQAVPALFLSAPRPLFSWAPARSRGPPVLS